MLYIPLCSYILYIGQKYTIEYNANWGISLIDLEYKASFYNAYQKVKYFIVNWLWIGWSNPKDH